MDNPFCDLPYFYWCTVNKGYDVVTHGTCLYSLSLGEGPGTRWWQYFLGELA